MFAIRLVDRATFLEHRARIRAWLRRKREAQLAGRDEDLLLAIERRQIDAWVAEQSHMTRGLWAVPYCAPELAEAATIPTTPPVEETKPAPAPAKTKITKPAPPPKVAPKTNTKVPRASR